MCEPLPVSHCRSPLILAVSATVLGVVGLHGAVHPAAARTLRYLGSLLDGTGSYVFDVRSHSFYLTNGLTVESGRFEASASVPVVLQNGGVVTTVRFSQAYRTRVDDPCVRAGGELLADRGRLRSVRVTAGAKIPVTDLDSGLGTGEWDYTVCASATAVVGRVFLLEDLAYWWLGDLPELELRDGLPYGVAGAVAVLDGRGTLMASVSGAHRLLETLDPPVSVGAALGYRIEGGWSLNGGFSMRLTESTSDVSLLAGWSRRFGHER